MIEPYILENSLKAFHSNDPEACEAECRKILEAQFDHPLGAHLLAWSHLQRNLDYGELLELLLASPETTKAAGIPAKASLGWLLWQANRTREAIETLTENLIREPNRQDLKTVLAICLLMDDQPAPAAKILRGIVDSGSGTSVSRFHFAHALLHLGQWHEGFDQLEKSRFDLPVHQQGHYANTTERLWVDQDICGKSIVIEGEQGFGDQIQFVRFAHYLKTELGAAEVHYCCHQALAELMQSVPFLDSAAGKIYSGFDYYIPVMSLPHRCQARTEGNLYAAPYLTADDLLIRKWQKLSPARSDRPLVGICWRSAPMPNSTERKVEGVNFVKNMKSLPLKDLDFLLSKLSKNTNIVSLQIDADAEEIPLLEAALVWRPEIENFTDTAALISICDHVITIDTATAHLAGALGQNTHLLLSKGADWRWTHESKWYPKTESHRQTVENSWKAPLVSAVCGITRPQPPK